MPDIKGVLTTVAFIVVSWANGQSKHVYFEKLTSWNDLISKAKNENKCIFVDCYATWCGPCKYMSDSIFTDSTVSKFTNQNFIALKVQIDQTVKDGDADGELYKVALLMREKYKINAVPSYLFFDSQGELIYQFKGVYVSPTMFISMLSKALDNDEKYFFLLEQFNSGRYDLPFLKRLIDAAQKVGDEKMIVELENRLK